MLSFNKDNYRFFFLAEFQRRAQRNSLYSWRAFARDLNMTSSRITEVMKGKAGLSVQKAKTLVEHLHLAEDEQELFFDLVEMEHGRNKFLRQLAKERILHRQPNKKIVAEEEFSLISKWYYLSLLSLLELSLPKQNPETMAKLLDISTSEINEALTLLLEMGFIKRENDRYLCCATSTTTARGTPSAYRREYNRQILKKAATALDTQPLSERSFTSSVMAIDKSQMEFAQDRIRQFRAELTRDLEATANKNAVYCLSVNFFSMTGDPK